jgi:MoxR-like ATPase
MQLSMGFPPVEAELLMLDAHLGVRSPVDDLEHVIDKATFNQWQETVPLVFVSDPVKRYAVDLVNAIRSDARALSPPSPRALLRLVRTAQAVALSQGRDFLTPADIQAVAADVFAHRMVVSGDETAHTFVGEILGKVRIPS